jgi:hypothetical protein
MRRLVVIGLIYVAVLSLALEGQYRVDPAGFIADPTQRVYQSLQLFVMEGRWTEHPDRRPIEVEVARFAAPFVTLTSLIFVFAQGAWVGIVNLRARFARGHVVLVGLNTLGWHFARSCSRARLRTVAIERDESGPYVGRCRRIGVPVIIGDTLAPSTLARAGVARASHLVTFVRDDGTNVELTLRVKAFMRRTAGKRIAPLRIRCHVSNSRLADRLEQYPKFFMDPHIAEISFFDTHRLAARTLLQKRVPEVFADALRASEVHVVILGGTPLAEQVMLQVAQMAHYANFALPRITRCLEHAAEHEARVQRVYPGLKLAAHVRYVEMDVSPDLFEGAAEKFPVSDATTYVVCLENESEGLGLALALRRSTLLGRGLNAPVMVAMERSDGLALLLESDQRRPEIPDGLYPFGMLDDIVSAANIVDERLDRLAQALHENYLETSTRVDAAAHRPSRVPWRVLPEEYRHQNRLEADHLPAKLRAAGCREEMGSHPFEFTLDELTRLAHMERSRFIAVRYSTGWRAGDTRSDVARVDENLDPWDSIGEARRSFDVATVRSIPIVLNRRLARCVRREIILGVSGHRPNRLSIDTQPLRAAIERTLDHIVEEYRDLGVVFAVMSPLAEGADRLVARIAMKRFRMRLYVPLPLPYDLYCEDFGASPTMDRDASISEFRELIGQAEHYYEMPLVFGSIVDLSKRDAAGARARSRQYALAGAYVVQRSHELIALWDGSPEEGEGGTAQIIAWRRDGVPAEYHFPNSFFPPVEPRAPFVIPTDAGRTFVPSRTEGRTA